MDAACRRAHVGVVRPRASVVRHCADVVVVVIAVAVARLRRRRQSVLVRGERGDISEVLAIALGHGDDVRADRDELAACLLLACAAG